MREVSFETFLNNDSINYYSFFDLSLNELKKESLDLFYLSNPCRITSFELTRETFHEAKHWRWINNFEFRYKDCSHLINEVLELTLLWSSTESTYLYKEWSIQRGNFSNKSHSWIFLECAYKRNVEDMPRGRYKLFDLEINVECFECLIHKLDYVWVCGIKFLNDCFLKSETWHFINEQIVGQAHSLYDIGLLSEEYAWI